jgi:endonuclease/exonuclease/phosphatase family metal-dependent hydrolase
MSERTDLRTVLHRTPGFAGGLLCLVLALGLLGCDEKPGTPEWSDTADQAAEVVSTGADDRSPAPASPAVDRSPPAEPARASAAPAGAGGGFRFIAYNVENWLTMDRFEDNKRVSNRPKPDEEKKAVVRILVKSRPDIIGLCEIGEARDLAEIQELLKQAGLNLPHSHFTGGSDPVRHLGLLSRFPITSTARPASLEYRLEGKTYGFGRGILDATVTAKGKPYRFLGVHLKSKRQTEEGDEEEMRVNEARLLRGHVDSILAKDPDARLVVYGDFNDTRPSRAFKVVTGNYNSPDYLTAIPFKDSRGHAWTHHWAPHDIYSRIDFVTVSRPLRTEVDFQTSHIIDDPEWDKASDHRPVLAIFR